MRTARSSMGGSLSALGTCAVGLTSDAGSACASWSSEEDVGREGLHDLLLLDAAQEEVLVDADVHGAQRRDDALMAHGIARRDERRAHRASLGIELVLDPAKRAEEAEERARLHRLARPRLLVRLERLEALTLEQVFTRGGEQDGIPVERDAHLVVARLSRGRDPQHLAGGEARLEGTEHVRVVRREKEVGS